MNLKKNTHVKKLSSRESLEQFERFWPKKLREIASWRTKDIDAWAESCFLLSDTGRPLTPEPHQRALLRLIERRRADGRHEFSTSVYSTIKKSGKTAGAAVVARFRAEKEPHSEIYIVANDLNQATNRVFQAIRESIVLTPDWQLTWRVTEHQIENLRNGSIIRAIPVDYRGEAGANPSLVVFTELWGYDSERARRLFDELTPVPTRDSTRLIETYAGYEGESELLWGLYEGGVLEGSRLTAAELEDLSGEPLGVFAEAATPDAPVPIWINEQDRCSVTGIAASKPVACHGNVVLPVTPTTASRRPPCCRTNSRDYTATSGHVPKMRSCRPSGGTLVRIRTSCRSSPATARPWLWVSTPPSLTMAGPLSP